MHPHSIRVGQLGLIAMVILFGLAGCATRPIDQLTQPAFHMPAGFPDSGTAAVANRWWTALDDPGLTQLIDYALNHNFNLQSAYARVKQAKATVASQRSNLFPSLSGSASASATHRPDSSANSVFSNLSRTGATTGSSAPNSGTDNTGGIGNGFSFSTDSSNWSTSRQLGLSASYEVDLFGRIRNGLQASKLSERAQQSALQSAAITLAGNIASQWYQYQEYEQRIALLKSQIKTNKDVLELTTFSFNNGQAAAADVLRQRQTVEASRGQLAQSRALATVARHALAVLVGKAPSNFAPPPGKLVALPPLPNTGVPSNLLMRRPDVRQQYFTLASDNRRVAVALAARYPQLSLSADFSGSAHPSALFTDWILQLGARLTQPIFDAGQRAAEVRRTRAVVDEDVASYQQTLLGALQEVDDALANERRQQQYLARLGKQLKLSRQVVATLRLRYLRGATSYLDVLDALLNRQQLQVNRLTGERQLLDYRINLYRALAGGIKDPNIGVNTATHAAAGDASAKARDKTDS